MKTTYAVGSTKRYVLFQNRGEIAIVNNHTSLMFFLVVLILPWILTWLEIRCNLLHLWNYISLSWTNHFGISKASLISDFLCIIAVLLVNMGRFFYVILPTRRVFPYRLHVFISPPRSFCFHERIKDANKSSVDALLGWARVRSRRRLITWCRSKVC